MQPQKPLAAAGQRASLQQHPHQAEPQSQSVNSVTVWNNTKGQHQVGGCMANNCHFVVEHVLQRAASRLTTAGDLFRFRSQHGS